MAKKLLKAVATVSVIGVITRMLSFLFRIYLSRELGAEILGVYQIACSIFVLFACFSSSGLPITLSRKTAQYDASKQFAHSKSIFSTALITACAISVCICIFFVLFPNTLKLLFSDERCIPIFYILLPSLISTSVYSITRAWFWGKKQFMIYSGSELVEEIIKIILSVTMLSFAIFGVQKGKTIALSYVICDFICAIILLILFFKKGGKFGKPKYLKEVTASATPITSTRLFSSFISSIIAILLPTLLIKTGLDLQEATAAYGRVSGMVMPILLAPSTIVGSLAVVMVPELAVQGAKSVGKKISKAIGFAMMVTSLFFAIFLASGKDIGIFIYKDVEAGILLYKSAFLIIPLVLNQLSVTFLNSLGRESWTFMTSLIASVGLILAIIFLPKFVGIYAYPISLFIYHTISLVLNGYKLRKTTKVGLSTIVDCIIFLIIGIVSALFGMLTSKITSDFHVFFALVCVCGVTGLVYFTSVLLYSLILKHAPQNDNL